MKRLVIVLSTLLVAVPLTMGVMAGVSFYGTGEDSMPSPRVTVLGTELEPVGYVWNEPVFGGTMYRSFVKEAEGRARLVGQLTDPTLELALPAGYACQAAITRGGEELWSGDARAVGGYMFLQDGRYDLQVHCEVAEQDKSGHGAFEFAASFTVRIEPVLETGETWVAQGDVLAIRLSNLAGDIAPELECEFGAFSFTRTGEGEMSAYVPIAWNRAAGDYMVVVRAGAHEWELPIRVTLFNFPTDVLSGTTGGTRDPAAVTGEAYAEFDETIVPLYEQVSAARRWSGRFQKPVRSGVTTGEYGVIQYVNMRPIAERSEGIEITAPTGTPVLAANDGLVVFAGALLNTGNTVVIDHGGGLKSYYYYMDELGVETGDEVKGGRQIGTVGSTGEAASAHLRFEVRIGAESISPTLLLNGASGLYEFE